MTKLFLLKWKNKPALLKELFGLKVTNKLQFVVSRIEKTSLLGDEVPDLKCIPSLGRQVYTTINRPSAQD